MKETKKIELFNNEVLEEKLFQNLMDHRLPDSFLYLGSQGAKNWMILSRSAGFTIAEDLFGLIEENVKEISELIPSGTNVAGIGVGSGEKERILLKELLSKGRPVYFPVDVSSSLLNKALENVKDLPVRKIALVGFLEELSILKSFWRFPLLMTMLGNTFCNYEPEYLLNLINNNMHFSDYFLFDCHIFPENADCERTVKEIEEIYRNPGNAFFNMSPLFVRGVSPEDCSFHLELVRVNSPVGKVYRTRKYLSIKNLITVAAGENRISFKKGDKIRMGFTYKYKICQIVQLLKKFGFSILYFNKNDDKKNALFLVKKKKKEDWHEYYSKEAALCSR